MNFSHNILELIVPLLLGFVQLSDQGANIKRTFFPHTASLTRVTNSQAVTTKTTSNGALNATACGEPDRPAWCSGSDVGAWINAAYDSLSSNGGSIAVFIPEHGLTFSTPININAADKPVVIQCYGSQGTSGSHHASGLIYTPSKGAAVTFNYGGNGNSHHRGAGLRDCDFSGTGGTSIGLVTGGSNGAEGFTMINTHISGFGTQWQPGNNTWQSKFDHAYLSGPGRLVNIPEGLTNAGEHFVFSETSFMGNGTFWNAIIIAGIGTQFDCIDCSFDDAQLTVAHGTALVNLTNPHFENPGRPVSAPFVINEGGNLTLTNPQVFQDFPNSTASSMVSASGGTTIITGMDSASPKYAYHSLFAVTGSANLYVLAPTNLGGSNNVFLSGLTSGRYLIDTGNACEQYPCQTMITNKPFAIQAPSFKFTGLKDTYGHLGIWQAQPAANNQDFIAVTGPNNSDYQDGAWGHIKLASQNNGPCTGYYSNQWQFWTTNSNSQGYANDNSSLVASIDCVGNATFIGEYYAGSHRVPITNDLGYLRGITATLKTSSAGNDVVAVIGMKPSGHCQLTPTNASAATNLLSTYVSAKNTDQIIVSHAVLPGMTYDVSCWPN